MMILVRRVARTVENGNGCEVLVGNDEDEADSCKTSSFDGNTIRQWFLEIECVVLCQRLWENNTTMDLRDRVCCVVSETVGKQYDNGS